MQQEVSAKTKTLRPHVKSHKCSKIAKMQVEAGAVGVAVAKVSEAIPLLKEDINNILITSPVVTEIKLDKLRWCLQKSNDIAIVVDDIKNAVALNTLAKDQNKILNVLIDIDPGIGRTGILYNDVISFYNELIKLKHISVKGIQCYAGNLQHIYDFEERKRQSKAAMQKAAECLAALQTIDKNRLTLTGSGTGTYEIDLESPAVTEVQPGSYTIMDSEYFSIQSNNNDEHDNKFKPAMRLLTTIISANKSTHVTCDAGWKALYEVSTPPLVIQPAGYCYSWGGFGDEHGKITLAKNIEQSLPKVGDVLELVVAHCDPTVNMFDNFYVIDDEKVIDEWPIDLRGKSQ